MNSMLSYHFRMTNSYDVGIQLLLVRALPIVALAGHSNTFTIALQGGQIIKPLAEIMDLGGMEFGRSVEYADLWGGMVQEWAEYERVGKDRDYQDDD